MAQMHHDPRTRPVPGEIQQLARDLMHERGPRRAAAALGISRSALLSVVAGADVLPGTLALMRESISGGKAA